MFRLRGNSVLDTDTNGVTIPAGTIARSVNGGFAGDRQWVGPQPLFLFAFDGIGDGHNGHGRVSDEIVNLVLDLVCHCRHEAGVHGRREPNSELDVMSRHQ